MEEEKRLLILFCNKLFINIDVKVAEFQTKQNKHNKQRGGKVKDIRRRGENKSKPEEKNRDEKYQMRMQHA